VAPFYLLLSLLDDLVCSIVEQGRGESLEQERGLGLGRGWGLSLPQTDC
jgi:hypothetical protein